MLPKLTTADGSGESLSFRDSCTPDLFYPPSNLNSFDSELELVDDFTSVLLSKLDGTNKHFLREFDSSNGIADLMLFDLRKDWAENLSIGNIPARWAYSFISLPYRKVFSLDNFIDSTLASRSTALSMLNKFCEAGLCMKNESNNSWKKLKQPRPIVNNIIAIEAKLRNWRKALSQAFRYLDYANQSWVLLDENSIDSAINNIEQFKHLNIGLASINLESEITVFFEPISKKPKSIINYWHANSTIANKYITSNNFYSNS